MRTFRATAAVSDVPGTTQSVDFYQLGTMGRLVDMPGMIALSLDCFFLMEPIISCLLYEGYGYAEVDAKKQKDWRLLLDSYLTARTTVLKRLFILVDARWGYVPWG